MDRPTPQVLARMPLAEAVLLLWRWIADETYLEHVFQRFRGRCYQKVISFTLMVHLIADALLQYGGSGRRSFERSAQAGELEASIQAAFGKLRRMPIALSMGFLAASSDRLRQLFPGGAATRMPKSLRGFHGIVLDGKAMKRVAKRLKRLRGVPGGLLGGRALVALDLASGMALAMHAHPDGEANDVRFVPLLLPEVRRRVSGPRLWVADRQFCDLTQTEQFAQQNDQFLVRYHPKVHFHADPNRPVRRGRDRSGRPYTQEWGWLGSPENRRRRSVRRITLSRPGEEDLILVTDLEDAERYTAEDLLDLYLSRWGIERMFQKVTEVFGLQGLIGGTPEATVFQFAFCLVLYNLIQVIRGYVAVAQERECETISLEKLFEDVERELIAWTVMVNPSATVAYFGSVGTAKEVGARLETVLGPVWTERWVKAPTRKRQPAASPAKARTHGSVYRILQEHRRDPKRRSREKARQ